MLTALFVATRILANPLSNVFQKQLTQRSANPVFIIAAVHALLTLACLPFLLSVPETLTRLAARTGGLGQHDHLRAARGRRERAPRLRAEVGRPLGARARSTPTSRSSAWSSGFS